MASLQRRRFLRLAGGIMALPALSRIARAQAYPSRPVRLLVGFAPGGGTDVMARLVQPLLSERLGQQLVIENRPGAGTNIATETVVNATPDGYTLLACSLANAGNATLYTDLKFNFIRDTTPIAGIALDPFVLQVTPSLPVHTIPELIAYAKANPGKVTIASAGTGSVGHLAGELFKMMAGIDMVHVPYRGAGPAMVDLMGGQVQVMFNTMSASLEHVRGGKLRALGGRDEKPPGGTAGASRRWRSSCTRLRRVELLDRHRRPERNAGRGRRQGQQGDQCGAGGSQDQGPPRRMGRHRTHRIAGRFRQAHRRRDERKWEQRSSPHRKHQGGVTAERMSAVMSARVAGISQRDLQRPLRRHAS